MMIDGSIPIMILRKYSKFYLITSIVIFVFQFIGTIFSYLPLYKKNAIIFWGTITTKMIFMILIYLGLFVFILSLIRYFSADSNKYPKVSCHVAIGLNVLAIFLVSILFVFSLYQSSENMNLKDIHFFMIFIFFFIDSIFLISFITAFSRGWPAVMPALLIVILTCADIIYQIIGLIFFPSEIHSTFWTSLFYKTGNTIGMVGSLIFYLAWIRYYPAFLAEKNRNIL